MILAPADVEAAVAALLDGSTRVPTNLKTSLPYIRVLRVGGDTANLIQSRARLTIECWAADDVAAFDAARLAWARLWASRGAFMGAVWVSRVELTEPVNLPDVDASLSRYQFIAQLTVALDEITPQEIA
jgi:hypothetical protein